MAQNQGEKTEGCDYNSIVKALNPPIEMQRGIRPRFVFAKEGNEAGKVYDMWHIDPENEAQGVQKRCILSAKHQADAKTITQSLNQEMVNARRRENERTR